MNARWQACVRKLAPSPSARRCTHVRRLLLRTHKSQPPASRAQRMRKPEMRDLKIEFVARDDLGSIVALVTPHGVVDACTVSADIVSGRASYFAGPDSYVRAP